MTLTVQVLLSYEEFSKVFSSRGCCMFYISQLFGFWRGSKRLFELKRLDHFRNTVMITSRFLSKKTIQSSASSLVLVWSNAIFYYLNFALNILFPFGFLAGRRKAEVYRLGFIFIIINCDDHHFPLSSFSAFVVASII